jgi:hypothetical protein
MYSAADINSLSSPSQTRTHAFLHLMLRQFTRRLISKQTKHLSSDDNSKEFSTTFPNARLPAY